MIETELIQPKKINDIPMIVSSFTFSIPSIIYYYKCDLLGSILFFIVTGTSIMADGVYRDHLIYDRIDLFVATTCYLYAGISTLIPSFMIGYITFSKQLLLYTIPLLLIKQSRSKVCRSESWRRWHMVWHYCASGLLTYSLVTLL